MKTKKKAVLFAFLCLALNLTAQESEPDKTKVALETDPATFVFHGYAAHIRVKPKTSKHWMLGAGIYGLDLPNPMVNMNQDNKNKGWNVRITNAYGLFGEYYFGTAGNKWFLGLQTSLQNYKITNDHLQGQESKYSNLLLMPSVGYVWQPFKMPIYIKPWAGIGYTAKVLGTSEIEGYQYRISKILPFATVHVGYLF